MKFIIAAAFLAVLSETAFAEDFQSTKIKQCSIEYKAAATDTAVEMKALGWPKFWSWCAKAHAGDKFLSRKQVAAQAK